MRLAIETKALNKARDLWLGEDFTHLTRFSACLDWVAPRIGVTTAMLLRLAGIERPLTYTCLVHYKDIKKDNFPMLHATREERSCLAMFLCGIGYTDKQVFEILSCDYLFRHKQFLKETRRIQGRMRMRIKFLIHLTELRNYIFTYNKAFELDKIVAEWKAQQPQVRGKVPYLISHLRQQFGFNKTELALRNRCFGLLKPRLRTIHKNKHGWLSVMAHCRGCGSMKPYGARLLIRGAIRSCSGCKSKRRAKAKNEFVWNVVTGRCYQTYKQAHQQEGITSIRLRGFERRFRSGKITRVDEGVFLVASTAVIKAVEYRSLLADVGISAEHLIPPDPDRQLKMRNKVERMLATRKKRASIYQRRRKRAEAVRRRTASFREQRGGYWSLANIKEYRKFSKEKSSRIKQETINADPLLTPIT